MKRCALLVSALVCSVPLHADEGSRWWERCKSGARAIPGLGGAADIVFGSEASQALAVQKRILVTNTSTLDQLRRVARSALAFKRKIEAWDRARRSSLQAAKALQKTHYGKAILGLGEVVLDIDLNPSKYVPQTAYTRQLKRDLNFGSDKRLVRRYWLKGSRRALAARPAQRSYTDFQQKMRQAAAYDRTLSHYTTARQLHLASHYEQMADHLLKENATIKALIEREEAAMSAAALLTAYDILHRNMARAAELKEKATASLEKASRITAEDQRRLAAQEDRLAARSLLQEELQWRRNHPKG